MIMKYLQDKATIPSPPEIKFPDWVSTQNASMKAWEQVEREKQIRELFIKTHHHATDYLIKSNYLIKPSEIAKAIGIHRSTLVHSSSYSEAFSKYLDGVNSELEHKKNEAVTRAGKSRGPIPVNKDNLLIENRKLKARLEKLELMKTQELISHAFDQLPLPIKKKLGIN